MADTSASDTGRLARWISERLALSQSQDAQLFLAIFRRYFRRYRAKLAIIVVLIAIISGTSAAIALMVETVVNELVVARNADLVAPLIAIVLTVFLAKGGAAYFQAVLSAQISNGIVADVQKTLFAHILRQRVGFFVRHASDALLMRFVQGAQSFSSILTTVLVDGVRDLATIAALTAVMFFQDPVLAVLCLIFMPAVYVCVVHVMKKIKRQAEQELSGYAALNKMVRETVQGITVVKAFNLEEKARQSADAVVDDLCLRRNRIAAIQAVPKPLLDTFGGIAVSTTIFYAGIRIITSEYDPGTFMSFITALLLAADPARRLSQMRVRLRAAFVAVHQVYDLLDDDAREQGVLESSSITPAQPSGAPGQPPAIRFDDVSFSYATDSPVLDGFTFNAEPGELVALVGPSGSGKTTAFRLLLKFYEPTGGSITIGETNLASLDPGAVRRTIAYVGQSNFMFDGSIRDNLTLMDPDVESATIEAICAEVGLDEFIAGLPEGLDTHVGELGSQISGGQAQRVNLARALIKDAPVLLLDEVTSALDAESEDRIKTILKRKSRSKTILVIAHRLSTVKDADRIVLMRDGRVVDCASHDELLRRNAEYEKIVALQFV